jgi:hypothetical protein
MTLNLVYATKQWLSAKNNHEAQTDKRLHNTDKKITISELIKLNQEHINM